MLVVLIQGVWSVDLMTSVSRGYQRTHGAPTKSCCPPSLIGPHPASQCYMVRRERETHSLTQSLALSHTDTFDLASVQFTAQVANVCVECCFINGSTAQGCHAEQRNFKSIVVRTFNASRLNGSLTTGTQCFDSNQGEYTMVVYDINSDSTLSDDPYTSSLVIVPTPPLPTSTVVPTPNITGNIN